MSECDPTDRDQPAAPEAPEPRAGAAADPAGGGPGRDPQPPPGPEQEATQDPADPAAAGAGQDEGGPPPDPWEDPARRPLLKKAVEGLVFASDRVITQHQLARIVDARLADVRAVLAEIAEDYSTRGVQLVEVGGGYQFRTSPDTSLFVRELVARRPVRLSRAQLETLALVAYRQPITRPEIDDVRGVDTGSALKVLLDRGLIKMLGRKDEVGRPLLYGTTPYFLEFFGLRGLKDLPTLKEFTELSDDSRTLFQRKTGETVEQAAADMGEAGEDVPEDDDGSDGDGEAEPPEGGSEAPGADGDESDPRQDPAAPAQGTTAPREDGPDPRPSR